MDANGANQTQLYAVAGGSCFNPKFNPAGTKVGFIRNAGGSSAFWEVDPNGANPVFRYSGTQVQDFDYHPTQQLIIFLSSDGRLLVKWHPILGTTDTLANATSPDVFVGVTFSPSGQYVAASFYNGNGFLSIYRMVGKTLVGSYSVPYYAYCGDWANIPRKKFFINSTAATLHTNAAGFLFGTADPQFSSLLAFDALTRNTVDVDPHPASSTSLSYTATITAADKLTMLRYANGMIAPRVTIIDPSNVATHAQGAVATFNAETGKVSSVLTFTRSRDAAKPATTREGNRLKFNHDFIAAYDEDGKLVRNAPKDVTMNTETGVVSY